MLRIIILDILDQPVVHGLYAVDQLLAGDLDLVVGVCQR
jgi:hypothetical protein